MTTMNERDDEFTRIVREVFRVKFGPAITAAVRLAVREAAGRPAEMSPEYQREYEHRERQRAVRVAIDTAWSQVYLLSGGCPFGGRGIELRSIELFGQVVSLPVMPGSIRR